jgi:transcriptional regulator with XRE-family HTH domain
MSMYDLTIPRRIVQRREERELAGYRLAEMAGISASYLSLIESGRKIPSEAVAVRLAEALGDDPDLYRAWVETAGEPNIEARMLRLKRIDAVRSRGAVAADALVDSAGMREWQRSRLESPPPAKVVGHTVQVPVLPEGADPKATRARPGSTIAIDRSLLDDDQDPDALFAYRVGERSVQRLAQARPGDVLVFSADPTGIDPAAIYAVRHRGEIVLSRVLYARPTLLLLGVTSNQPPIPLTIADTKALHRVLAGVAVAGVRSWPRPQASMDDDAEPMLGRAGKLDAGHIVRDCEWKENYGWRPVQRAADMDYLLANPDKTIRFRLIRDGRVQHVLEMNAEQWQAALGDYYDGPTWYANGYVVAITRRQKGAYTDEFQDRWAPFVRKPSRSERELSD